MSYYYLHSERPFTEKDGKLSFTLRGINCFRKLKKEFPGKWEKYTITNGSNSGIIGAPGVYAITVKNKKTGKEDICYVGSSKSVSVRLYSHKIISFLTFYLSPDFTIDVYVFYVDKFLSMENKLIAAVCPFLNYHKPEIRRFDIRKKYILQTQKYNG